MIIYIDQYLDKYKYILNILNSFLQYLLYRIQILFEC
jgi:hypothetical protein